MFCDTLPLTLQVSWNHHQFSYVDKNRFVHCTVFLKFCKMMVFLLAINFCTLMISCFTEETYLFEIYVKISFWSCAWWWRRAVYICFLEWWIILAVFFKVGFTGKRTIAILVLSEIVFHLLKKYFIAKVYNIFVTINSFYSSIFIINDSMNVFLPISPGSRKSFDVVFWWDIFHYEYWPFFFW